MKKASIAPKEAEELEDLELEDQELEDLEDQESVKLFHYTFCALTSVFCF